MVSRGTEVTAERWTGNAAMWIDERRDGERVYHCSHAESTPPNFEDMVFSLRLS